jgi:hypothetical protein
MLFFFPTQTVAVVWAPYERPYPDPISLTAGDCVLIDSEKTKKTDILGWSWCTGPDRRQGWVPNGWITHEAGAAQIVRDFNALEITITVGDRVTLHYGESGFVFVTHQDGSSGWVPDACLQFPKSQKNNYSVTLQSVA